MSTDQVAHMVAELGAGFAALPPLFWVLLLGTGLAVGERRPGWSLVLATWCLCVARVSSTAALSFGLVAWLVVIVANERRRLAEGRSDG